MIRSAWSRGTERDDANNLVLGQTIGIQGVPSCRKLEVEYYRPDQRSGAGAGALPLPEVLMAVSCAHGRKNKTSANAGFVCLSHWSVD
jgi:hypothetical protein